jgi:hypothetical protein
MKKISIVETMELVANLSVIAGLVFLAFQVRQNTAAVQAQTLQSLVESSASFLENLARDPESQTIVRKLATNPDEVTEDDAFRVALLMRAQMTRYQSAYLQWQKGSLSEEGWISYTRVLCSGGKDGWSRVQALSWPTLRTTMLDGFRDFAEKCRPDLAAVGKAKESTPVAN